MGVLLMIIGTGLVTVIPRVLPLMILSKFQLPQWAEKWLSFVPITVMASLIAQEIFIHEGELVLIKNNLPLLAAIPTCIIAIKTQSLLFTVLGGMVSLMILRFFFG